MRPTVLIADDHAIVRHAIRPLVESIDGAEVVGEADNGLTAIALAKKFKPDLLILDLSMPQAGGTTVIGEVRRFSPGTRIAVLTGIDSTVRLAELESLDVEAILLKSADPDELCVGFRAALAGQSFIGRDARAALETAQSRVQLTTRERQIVSLAAQGKSNADIAQMLNISHKTVDNHRTSVMRKLGVHSAAELAATAIREGLTDG